MNLESRKLLLGVGLISFGTSFSSGDTSVLTSDIHASADWVNGDGGCINGEQHMHIRTARPFPWFDSYAITWRQLSDGCKSPVADGFEASILFKPGETDEQGEDLSTAPPHDDGIPPLSLDVCAPYGYYELEIKVEGDNTENQENALDIQWEIDAPSDEGRKTTKWSGIAELSEQHKQSAWYVPNLRPTPCKTWYVWPVKNQAGYQMEKMWSGPEPQKCVSDFSKEEISDTFDEGCYDYVDNTDIFWVVGAPSSDMTTQNCVKRCQKEGYGYSATTNGKFCLCGDTAPRYKRSLDACDVPCSGDSRFLCGGNESNWYLSVVRLLQTSQSPNASRRRRTLVDDDKSVGAPLATKNVEKDTGKDTVAAKEKIVATPVLNKVIEEEPKSTYKGCFAVKENPGLLTTHVNCNLEMSNKVCKGECLKLGFWYAGTTLGTECYCGDKAPLWDTRELFCELECEDKDADGKNCGGWGFMTVFELSKPVSKPLQPDSQTPKGKGVTYEGCYSVKENPGILKKFITSSEWMTNEKCQKKCLEIKNWYSATTQGTDCYCGNQAPVWRTASHFCDLPCEDDNGKGPRCGGWGFMDVFHIEKPVVDLPEIPRLPADGKDDGASYEGCYNRKENPDVFNKFVTSSEWMTNEKCQKKCRELGNWYAATTQGRDCYCGDKPPTRRTASLYCDLPCEDDKEGKRGIYSKCGGWGFLTVYAITKPALGLPRSGSGTQDGWGGGAEYKGCYSVKGNPDVFLQFVTSSKEMSNEKCENECREIDLWYSATTQGEDCYCGDKAPVWKTDDKFCEVPCENGRGKGRNCGGWGFMSVFQITKPVPVRPAWPSPTRGTGGGVTYKGCYNVKDNPHVFDKPMASSKWMTNEMCEKRCREIGHWYSATSDGTECYCGDKAPVKRTSDWYCDIPCEERGGDDKDPKCGGRGYLTVFQLEESTPAAKPPTPASRQQPDVVTYKGCYDATENPFILDEFATSSQWMTNEKCQKKCQDIDYRYSATTDGTACYCGDRAPIWRTSDWYCDLPCKENGKDSKGPKCGGRGYLTVFHTSEAVPDEHSTSSSPPKGADDGVAYEGCYNVYDNSDVFNKFVKSSRWMTNEVCQDKCRDIEYEYSATTEGTDCYCGNKRPVLKKDDWQCKLPCEGGSEVMCGGWEFMSVFHVQKPVSIVRPSKPLTQPQPYGTYKGCYDVRDNSGLSTKNVKSSKWMTNEVCQKACGDSDHWYSATIEGTECYCGDKPPIHRRDDWNCKLPCADGAEIKCGGRGFMTVFEIQKPTPSSEPKERMNPTNHDVPGAQAKGCFEDSKSKRVLGGHSYSSNEMTAQECGRVCKSKSHTVFGVEFGRECFCGDKVPTGDGNADKCNEQCTGDIKKICGGHSRINIYEFTENSSSHPSLKEDKVAGAETLGCYQDNTQNRVLKDHSFDDKTNMTAQRCGDECFKKGYKVFGTEFGRECFCGHDSPAAKWKADKCDSECTGNKEVACGGRNRINIFKWDDSEPILGGLAWDTYNGASPLGCFRDDSRRRVLGGIKKDDKGMSTQVCGDFCKDEGYAFFGTQYSKECFCGNDFKSEGKVDGGECDYACAGKSSTACGGKNRVSVFKFDEGKGGENKKVESNKDGDNKHADKKDEDKSDVVEPKESNMLGCFKDSWHKRVLNLKRDYKLDDMTPEKCYTHCKLYGAVYYGVEFGKECFCGDRNSKHDESPLDERSCTMPCSGDRTKICGGKNAINVYGPPRHH